MHSDSNIVRQSQLPHVTTAKLLCLIPLSSNHLSCMSRASLRETPLSTWIYAIKPSNHYSFNRSQIIWRETWVLLSCTPSRTKSSQYNSWVIQWNLEDLRMINYKKKYNIEHRNCQPNLQNISNHSLFHYMLAF